MTERIHFLPVLKLTWEYFKENKSKFLLYSLLTSIWYFFFFTQIMMLFDPTIIDLASFYITIFYFFTGLLALHLLINRKRRNYLFHAGLGLFFILYQCILPLIVNISSNERVLFFYPILLFIPIGLHLAFSSRVAFSIIEEEPISFAKISRYTPGLPKVLFILLTMGLFFTATQGLLVAVIRIYSSKTPASIAGYVHSFLNLVRWLFTRYFLARLFCSPFLVLEHDLSIVESFKVSWKITKGNIFAFFSPYILYSGFFFIIAFVSTHLVTFYAPGNYHLASLLNIGLKALALFPCYFFTVLLYRLMSNTYFDEKEKEATVEDKEHSNTV